MRILAACLLLLAGCRSGTPQQPHEEGHAGEHEEAHEPGEGRIRIDPHMLRDLRVTTRPAESRPAGDAVTVLGELRIDEDRYAEVGTSIHARVTRVLAAPGDAVRRGQPLVELHSPEVGRARAEVTSTAARLDVARRSAERRRGLAGDSIVPARELEAAEAALAQAEAEHRAALQVLEALGAMRGEGARFELTSPIDATVIERNALRGRMAGPEQALFVLGDLARMWIVVHAFERDALRVRPGATARVTFPALPGVTVTATVARVGSQVDPTSRTVDVRLDVENPSGVLRPGMSATALVPLGEDDEKVVAVPVEALQRQPEGWCVFLPLEPEGTFEIRPVGRGRDLGAEVEVLSGLEPGEPVVVDGAFLLKAEADKARGGSDEHHH